jgi:predicted dehydrogenase
MKAICGRDEEGVQRAAEGYEWEWCSTDWRELIESTDIDLIDICTPPHLHKEIAVAAAAAGKDVVCEKPLARTLSEAVQMLEAVSSYRVRHATAFNYRCVPAIQLAREMIDSDEIGEILQWRAHWLSELMDPELPLSWFFQKEKAGSGALQDIGSHIIDLAHYLVGRIDGVSAVSKTFIPERYVEGPSRQKREVDVDDAVQFLARFSNGAIGSFEASRVAGGYRDEFNVEVHGSRGTIGFNSKILYELEFYTTNERAKVRGPRKIFVGSAVHPYQECLCPYGEVIGRNDLFIIQAYEILKALSAGVNPSPSFVEGGYCQAVMEAVLASAEDQEWKVPMYRQIDHAAKLPR